MARNQNQQKTKQQPAHEVRMGVVKAIIWENNTDQGVRYNVQITRLYKQNDEWKQTDSFGRDDLPLVEKVVSQAHEWIYAQAQ
jgi:hypothetical protein